MSHALKIWTLHTGSIRYEKIISTRNRGQGQWIEAPILAYLIETPNGRILYDVGCDYQKLTKPALRTRYFASLSSSIEIPRMQADQRVPHYLERLGLTSSDIDLIFISHLHFDHAGGLGDLPGCEVHIHRDELTAAKSGLDSGVFADELVKSDQWYVQTSEYEVAAGVQAITTPGHTAGHMSLLIRLPKGRPVILCGDAADLNENLSDEIAPGCCWQDNVEQALASIRKLKLHALIENAQLWPNHDLAFFKTLPEFPLWRD